MDSHHIAVVETAGDGVDLVVIDPGTAGFDGAALAFFQSYDCMIHR